jgi:RNA polymerase sigma-70 factor (ECF subfamily)
MSYKEIADVTALTVSNVGFLLHTAMNRLRTSILAAGE